ncbi:hypothetical protein BE21_21050 [Sorangium cellulosum]|uniref:Uncharacterized protein n=1 Tax=Sorangium cellulosum TaxID=56 RepID=A0A150TW16_SORCE|nr:hypothetical protein BE21_21050 [Sorangium cellulosum]
MNISIIDAWGTREARELFRSVWPMYVHEISGFDTSFYVVDEVGRWQPDIVNDWVSSVTPPGNLRTPQSDQGPTQPFQRAHVSRAITISGSTFLRESRSAKSGTLIAPTSWSPRLTGEGVRGDQPLAAMATFLWSRRRTGA